MSLADSNLGLSDYQTNACTTRPRLTLAAGEVTLAAGEVDVSDAWKCSSFL